MTTYPQKGFLSDISYEAYSQIAVYLADWHKSALAEHYREYDQRKTREISSSLVERKPTKLHRSTRALYNLLNLKYKNGPRQTNLINNPSDTSNKSMESRPRKQHAYKI